MVYLNDPNARNYGDTVILPFIQAAADEVQVELVAHGLGIVEEYSAPLTVVALASEVPTIADLVQPINVWERTPGSQEQWQLMDEGEFEPVGPEPRYSLGIWIFRKEKITVPPAQVNRDVLVQYNKRAVSSALVIGTNIPVLESLSFLAARTASLAAAGIGRNFDLAGALSGVAEEFKQILIGTMVKETQDEPVRPQPFRSGRR